MSGSSTSGPVAVLSASGQTAVAVGAHVLAVGCLPAGRSLVLVLPACVLAVVWLTRLLGHRPLAALAAGQLASHLLLTLLAVCATTTTHDGSAAMTAAHVAAVVLLRAGLDRSVRLAMTAAGALRARPPLLVPVRLPQTSRPCTALPTRLRDRASWHAVPVRGPPVSTAAP